MHPEEIKAAIRMTGTTPAYIADGIGVSRTCVSHVIHSRGISAKVAKRIAEVTGIPVARLWPGKYPALSHPSGSVIHPTK